MLNEINHMKYLKVSPRSPKCNFLIRPCKPKWIERKNTRLKQLSEQFVREKTYKGGRGAKAPRPPL